MKKFVLIIGISFLVCLLALVGVIFVPQWSGCIDINKPSEETPIVKPFKVTDKDGKVLENNSNVLFESGKSYNFFTNSNDYTVTIIPNSSTKATDFAYEVDGKSYNFRGLKDLEYCFNFGSREQSFGITLDKDQTVFSTIERVYPNKTVTIKNEQVRNEVLNGSQYYFTLKVSANDGSAVVYINFGITDGLFIELPDRLVF